MGRIPARRALLVAVPTAIALSLTAGAGALAVERPAAATSSGHALASEHAPAVTAAAARGRREGQRRAARAPSVRIASPGSSATVSGSATYRATARDADGIASVTFAVDGRTVSVDRSAPYMHRGAGGWNTRSLSDGRHTLRVTATDTTGTTSTATQTVTVRNRTDRKAPTTPTGLATTGASGSTASFAWSASRDSVGVTGYRVWLDGVLVDTVPGTDATVGGLACGSVHGLAVAAVDAAGNQSGKATVGFAAAGCPTPVPPPPPPPVEPDTMITSGPSGTATTADAGFVFDSTADAATFECRLNSGSWTACSAPRIFTGLANGTHTFSVRSSAAGMTDGTPAARTWTVAVPPPADTTAPETTISSGPSGTVATGAASFSFTSGEAGSTFECRIDGGTWSACTSPKSYSGLASGGHTFEVRAEDAAGNTDATAASRTWTVNVATTPPPPPPGAPTLQQVDGGLGWYGQFSNGLPTDQSYFPIGVWLESVTWQGDIDKDKDVGLNLYVGLTANSNMSTVRSNGMRSIFQTDERDRVALGTEQAGWLLHDEIDMQREPTAGCIELKGIISSLPADGRVRYNNFGKGVMFWETLAQASCYVNATQLNSNDIYWFTDPNVCSRYEGGATFTGATRALTATECRRASNYGATVQKMRNLVSPLGSRPVWNFIEVGHPFTEFDAPTITGPQIRAAVWHSLIAGARGILYFNHNFGGTCTSQHVLRDACGAAVRPTVKAVNGLVKTLAPVLNSPNVTSGWTMSSTVKSMVKWSGSNLYVFAGSTENANANATFSMPCVGNATATVVDEGRTIPVVDGTFTDNFADGNAVHIYRIDGGSTCGLV